MNDKILISENRGQGAGFEKKITDVIEKCNELISAFHAFQSWKRIETEDDFLKLVVDPAAYFDQLLIGAVNIQVMGGVKVNPEHLAKLVGIDRDEWLNMVAGMPVSEGCEPCRKAKIRKGQRAISIEDYEKQKKYIVFQDGAFFPNIAEIEAKKESFRLYATNQKQIEAYNHWQGLCDALNKHFAAGHVSRAILETFAAGAGFIFSYGTNKFHVDENRLASEILNYNNHEHRNF